MSADQKPPYPEKREEPWVLSTEKTPGAPASVLGDPAYATIACPCEGRVHVVYYTAEDVTHAYCAGCDHMHLLPEAIKKKRLS
jgi:hypothetical protein